MADDKITVGIELQDDLTPKIQQIKSTLSSMGVQMQQSSAQMAGGMNNFTNAMNAAWNAVGKGAQTTTPQINAVKQSVTSLAHETDFWSEQIKELTAGIGYQIGLWNVGFMVGQKVMEAVGEAITVVLDAQKLYQQESYRAQNTTEEWTAAWNEFSAAGIEAAGSMDEFQKFTVPAERSLQELGITERDARIEALNLTEQWKLSGEDMRRLAVQTDLGVASFHELAQAGTMMDNEWRKEIATLEHEEAQAARVNRELSHAHTIQTQQRQDTDELSAAHQQFSEKTGLAASAWNLFQQAGRALPSSWAKIPDEFAKIPGGVQLATKQIAEMQAKMTEGTAQMSKELGISPYAVQQAIAGKLPGFGQEDILAAQRRSLAQQERHDDQAFAEQQYQTEKQRDDKRLAANKEVQQALQAPPPVKPVAPPPEEIRKGFDLGIKWLGDWSNSVQDAGKQTEELRKKAVPPGTKMPESMMGIVSGATLPLPDWMRPSPLVAKPAESFADFAKDKTLQDISQLLNRVLSGG